MAKAKGTKVSEKEKKKMWLLYQECGSVCQVAKKMKRDRGTVSRHIMAYEASLRTANILTESHNY